MKNHLLDSSINPIAGTDDTYSELALLHDRAMQGDANAIALWALSILESDRTPSEEFIDLIARDQSQWLWIGKLACTLVTYRYDIRRAKEDPLKIVAIWDDGSRRPCDGHISNALWDVILLAEAWFFSLEANKGSDFYQLGSLNVNDDFGLLFTDESVDLEGLFVRNDFRNFERTRAMLRELSSEYVEAQYILAISGDTTENWLVKASERDFMPASYRLGFDLYKDNPEKAIGYFSQLDLDIESADKLPEGLLDRLRRSAAFHRRNLQQILDTQKDLEKEKEYAKFEKEKYLAVAIERAKTLSALSHTLHNSLVTGPEIVRSAIRILGASHDNLTPREAKAVNDLTALYTTFEFTEQLIQTFKLQISDPEKLSREVAVVQPDLPSIGDVVIHGLQQVVARVIFNGSFLKRAFHLAGSRDNKTLLSLRADFRAEMLGGDDQTNVRKFLQWIDARLPGIKVNIASEAFHYPLHNQAQHALIFAIVSELMLNALRHAADSRPIEITILTVGASLSLTIRNAFVASGDEEKIKIGNGGLSFVKKLADYLSVPGFFKANFQWKLEDDNFQTTLTLTNERKHQNEYRMD